MIAASCLAASVSTAAAAAATAVSSDGAASRLNEAFAGGNGSGVVAGFSADAPTASLEATADDRAASDDGGASETGDSSPRRSSACSGEFGSGGGAETRPEKFLGRSARPLFAARRDERTRLDIRPNLRARYRAHAAR
ncbi:MAG TPA: hypothetical protein VGM56_14915 [Byssovorax sp.]